MVSSSHKFRGDYDESLSISSDDFLQAVVDHTKYKQEGWASTDTTP